MIIIAPRFVKILTGNFARAITLYPLVFVRDKTDQEDAVLLNHESIHLRQQREWLVLPFYLCYLMEYLIGRLGGRSHYEVYRHISFEQEAYTHEHDIAYLQQRKSMPFKRYRLQKK